MPALFFPQWADKSTSIQTRLWRKADTGMVALQPRVVLSLRSSCCLWGLTRCPPGERLCSPSSVQNYLGPHFSDLWAICSAQPLPPWLIMLLSLWITALYFICLSLKYLWFHILSEEIYKRRALLEVQMMMEKECVATNSCRSLYWIPWDLLKGKNIGREWAGWEEWRAHGRCLL